MTHNAEKGLPLADRAVAHIVGRSLVWLGKRAFDRGDLTNYNAALAALRGGDTTPRPPADRCICPNTGFGYYPECPEHGTRVTSPVKGGES